MKPKKHGIPIIKSDGRTDAAVPMRFSVIIPAYNAQRIIQKLLDSIACQSFKAFETIIVDDGSTDDTPLIAGKYHCTVIRSSKNRGPAFCRNLGARHAKGDILVFTDSDCVPHERWMENIRNAFDTGKTDAVMGRVMLEPSDYMGDSISALGFPAGGSIGFEKVWRVDPHGYTQSLSTCNCAVKKSVFTRMGGFDETFPYAGGEDSFLAYQMCARGYKIKFCPNFVIYHQARNTLRGFLTWQFKRGISSYIFSTKVGSTSDFLSLRLWSVGNVIKTHYHDKKFPMIVFLLGVGYAMQVLGYIQTKRSDK